ncbi:Trk system potassium transporter TrkA [Clostridium sp. CF012]|uniref:Trk system potassium transporter TrkA n=1 Tax=Clostridium sp. CF012 TaxID=2843319 RepID=UPI001C0C899E|nr:Trk system potassium transporter TrkA [Clostridium sp. CF012]MBU3142931.1 Trk system potassium transporter TrkA [Clostridium sp. CF012]
MKIIIIGAGKVGYTLAENLVEENNDVTIIDISVNAIEKVEDNLDVMSIKGSGVSTNVLLEAGIEHADLLIAVTGTDVINMVCCLTAKKLGVRQTVARVRDPEYADELSLIKEQLGVDFVINPEFAAADEIARTLGFSSAINVERFASGRVIMVELKITSKVEFIGKRVRDIFKHSSSIILGVLVRDEEVIVPKGDEIIKENDLIYVIGKSSRVYNFCKICGKYPEKIKNVMIMGGGRIAYYLYKLLISMNMNIKIIEIKRERCYDLSDALPNALIINSDGTEEEVLLSENIENMDSFVAVTGIDEQNLMSSLIAKKIGVKKVITKISRTNYIDIVRELGIDCIITPKLITTNQILKYARGNAVESLLKIAGGEVEILEFIVDKNSDLVNKQIKNIGFMENTLIATIVRKHEVVMPRGEDIIKKGDRIIVITKQKNISRLNGLQAAITGGL